MSKLRTVSRLLDLKERKKEEIENEVGQLRGRIRQLEARLEELEKKFCAMTHDFEEKQRCNDMNVHKLDLFYACFMNLCEEMKAQKKEIILRIAELNGRQTALIEAYKEKKLFEIIRDRIVKEEVLHKEKAEQKELDFQHLAGRLRGR